MDLFLSYASEQRSVAEQVAFGLRGEGHRVFFDRADIGGGDDFHAAIRRALASTDLLVFLISPESVRRGSYALTELKIASERWEHPRGRILPVMVADTPVEAVPAFLRAVSILQPEGDVAAEVIAAVERIRRGRARTLRSPLVMALAAVALVAVTAGGLLWSRYRDERREEDLARDALVRRAEAIAGDTVFGSDGAAPARVQQLLREAELYLHAGTLLDEAEQMSRRRGFALRVGRLLGEDVAHVTTPNQGTRTIQPEFLVFHYTASPGVEAAVRWMQKPESRASTHLVIARDGKVTQLVPFGVAAWHVGASTGDAVQGLNQRSIGIHLDNVGRLTLADGAYRDLFGNAYPTEQVVSARAVIGGSPGHWQSFTDAQVKTAIAVSRLLKASYGLESVVGHYDAAANRKEDPGPVFPMELVRQAVLGGDVNQLAYDRLSRVLDLDPDNAEAKRGVAEVMGNYLALADGAIARGQLDAAAEYVGRADRIAPAHRAVHDARERLRAARGS